MPTFENILFAVGLLLLLSTFLSKTSERFGIPVLVLFLLLGMLAGSEGLGGIYFDNYQAAKSLGIVALMFILFSGGFDTPLKEMRHVLLPGIVLSTLGVIISTVVVAYTTVYLLHFTWLEGLLLGAIVSSTDAAAVFNVLRTQKTSLRGKLQPLIEFESGSNDPMAVFLTVSLISLIKYSTGLSTEHVIEFFLNIPVGLIVGFLFGRGIILIINNARLTFEGLYPALLFSLIFLCYTTADALKGNGFLAVYLAGIISGNAVLLHKKTMKNFLEGFSWLMQIIMFLTLGLLVFPTHIVPVVGIGVVISLVLIFLARPLSVFTCLAFSNFNWKEKAMVSWVGLRGAIPIILATFPLLAGLPESETIFNVVFFIVLTSVLIQGTTVPIVAKWLKVDAPSKKNKDHPIELSDKRLIQAQMEDVIIPFGSVVAGKSIINLGLPSEALIVLICRNEQFFIPNGSTILQEGDICWILGSKSEIKKFHKIIQGHPPKPSTAE